MERTLLIVLALLLSQTAVAAERCSKADSSFSAFLTQFEENQKFQKSRIIYPLVYRSGAYWIADPEVELWDRKKVVALKEPLIYGDSKQKELHLLNEVLINTHGYVELYQHKDEADTYQFLFKFRNVGGCWFLEELHDTSL